MIRRCKFLRSAVMSKTIFDGAHTQLVDIMIAARKRSGLTQVELAAKVGRDQTFISLIERSQRRIDVLEFIALARAMGEDPQRLFSELISNIPLAIEI